jgi:hypothetical protein
VEVREFTLEAVNALVPKLEAMVARQMERREGIEAVLARLGRELGEVPDRIVLDPADPHELRELKRDLVERIEAYKAGWQEVEELGAVLKDPRLGLLDFYGRVDDKLVWLCWKYGEPECTFFHALNEGFSARKPIGASVKHRLLN